MAPAELRGARGVTYNAAQRVRVLDEATKRATFWDAWLRTQLSVAQDEQQVAGFKNKVHNELAALASTVEDAFRDAALQVHAATVQTAEHRALRKSLPWLRRWLLLYRPPRPLAWLPRLFFYMSVAELLIYPFLLTDSTQRKDWQYGVVGFIFLIAVFRGLSVWIERPHLLSQRAQ